MRFLIPLILLTIVQISCWGTRPSTPDWIASAPESAILGISCRLGWILERPEFRKEIIKYPVMDQALELFLNKANIDPITETGRISVYALEGVGKTKEIKSLDDMRGVGLVQMSGFRDQKAIQRIVVESFAPDSGLKVDGREFPLFVVLDINNFRIRVYFDNEERLWIGDIASLQEMAKRRRLGDGSQTSRAAAWMYQAGILQGFVQPELIPDNLKNHSSDLIAGMKALTWSISTAEKDEQIIHLDLVASGDEKAMTHLKPWMTRITGLASSLADSGTMPPDTIQEKTRLGIRCQFRKDQLGKALESLGLDNFVLVPKQ